MKRLAPLLLLTACAHGQGASLGDAKGNLHAPGVRAKADPTVQGARLVPEVVEEEKTYGVEPGGGLRSIASGIRVVSLANGALLAAEDKLPAAPQSIVEIPARMGGGFLFVITSSTNSQSAVWRADKWLDRARPIYVSPGANNIQRVLVGLDRVYLRGNGGAHRAIDPRTGAVLDQGALPATPHLGAFGAMDGWRAVAIADLRGVVATFDAGATWKPLGIPIDAKEIVPMDDGVAVGGVDTSRSPSWYLVRPDGQVSRMAVTPKELAAGATPPTPPSSGPTDAVHGGAIKTFGKRPLVAAIEDGWPIADRTAVVARDGALARVRLSDGAMIDFAPDAFPLKPARCHAIALASGADPTAFGFVCGEPRGKTVIYRYDTQSGRMTSLRQFEHPRAVFPSSTGALAVRGACADDAQPEDAASPAPERAVTSYCIRPRDGEWREVQLQGRAAGERVVALADGRFVIISPPHGELGAARITVLDTQMNATTFPIVFAPTAMLMLPPEAARVIRSGLWVDGFEERARGQVGGWIEAAGSFLGIQIKLDGQATVGAFIRDQGAAVVSGRYGLGWTASRRGFETTDGGMTWNPVDLADRIGPPRAPSARACGPAGCLMSGWVRTGWGAPKPLPAEPPSTTKVANRSAPILDFSCEPTRGAPQLPAATPSAAPVFTRDFTISSGTPWVGGAGTPRAPLNNVDWTPFYAVAAPKLRTEELGLSLEVGERLDRGADRSGRAGSLLRFYAWGPKGAEWARSSRWLVRFVSPFGSSQDVVSTQVAAPAKVALDWAYTYTGGGVPRAAQSWQVAAGDDPQHMLLVAHRATNESVPLELEADRTPVEIRRADGEPFGVVDSAVRVGGRWILAGPQNGTELSSTVIWEVDGGVARELVRIPRAESGGSSVRLARRPDGRSIGLVVDGQMDPDRSVATRWLLPIDLGTGSLGELESLGDVDFADRKQIGLCAGDDPGFIVDLPWSGTVRVKSGAQQYGGSLRNVVARVRVSHDRMCIERMSGSLDGAGDSLARGGATAGAKSGVAPAPARGDNPTIEIAAFNQRTRYPLRCTRR
jgi:hypothetical protein